MVTRTTDVLVDLQFGSTGKGLLAGYMGVRNKYSAVISCNMPNAGHTAYCPVTDQKFVHKVLPSAIFYEDLKMIGVGPGAVFSIDRLEEEWEAVCNYKKARGHHIPALIIHAAAGILRPEHAEAERNTLSRISSTMQGSAEALIDKIRRNPAAIAGSNDFQITHRLDQFGPTLVLNQDKWLSVFASHSNILLEGSQGYSLGLSSGFYPFCTSRDCTPARVISDCSIPVGWLRDVFGSCRVHPIRVGNTPDGYSGDWYIDQHETTFEALGAEAERTTVTQRVRRIATFSEIQIREAMAYASPTEVFLNFCNYDEAAAEKARLAIESAAEDFGCGGVRLMGWGPKPADIAEV